MVKEIEQLLDSDLARLEEKLRALAVSGEACATVSDFASAEIRIASFRGGLLLDGHPILSVDPTEEEKSACMVLELVYLDRDFGTLDVGRYQMLENASSRVFHTEWEGKRLLVVLPRAVVKAATVINERNSEYLRLVNDGPIGQRRRWCYENRKEEVARIRTLQAFESASMVVANNQLFTNIEQARRHLEGWLLLMPQDKRDLLTRVIAAHESISAVDETAFVERLAGLESSTIAFSLNDANDVGGLHRLVISSDFIVARDVFRRAANVERELQKALSNGGMIEIAIMTDVIVSGGQILRVLREYYLADELDRDRYANQNFVAIDDRDRFREGLRSCNPLRIIAALYTENCEQRLKAADGIPELLGISPAAISFEGRKIALDACFLCGPSLDSMHQSQFKELIQDLDFVRSTFTVDSVGDLRKYQDSLSERMVGDRRQIDLTNLITRRGSVTKKTAMIFCMNLRSGYPALFKTVGERRT